MWRMYVDNVKNTILHKATAYLSPTDYYDLLQFIPRTTLKLLLQMSNDKGDACLHLIVKRGLATADILNLILSNGFDINTSETNGKTCIFYAVEIEKENMRIPTVKLLLENGADATRVSSDGNSIMHYSAEMDGIDCLRFLLDEKNMNVNQINELGDTPIFSALRNRDSALQTVQFLLEQGADYRILNSHRSNLLHYAAEYRQLECLQLFLSLGGLNINQADDDGDTPLLLALIEYDGNTVEMTTLLLDKGADHTISNKQGENVLHRLAENACAESLHHFVGLPSLDANARDSDNDTPLHILFRNIDNYHESCFDDFNSLVHNIEELLSLGADVNAKNNDGETPLDIYEREILEWGDNEELMKNNKTIRSLLEGPAWAGKFPG